MHLDQEMNNTFVLEWKTLQDYAMVRELVVIYAL
jgi:hypothetical protein